MICGSAAALPEGAFDEFASVSASAVTDGDWEYVVLDDDTISLTKYNGGGGTVTIPSTFEGKDVVSFGTIFKGNNNIAKVIIPDTVTNIADNAFNSCPNLSSVTIGSGVTNIGDYAFYNCEHLQGIAFPNGLTNIGKYAFNNDQQLRTVHIPGTVKSIGDYAFNDMYWLNELIIEEGVEVIGIRAFTRCVFLKSITLPKSLTSIGKESFGYRSYTHGTYIMYERDSNHPISFNCYKDSVAQVYAMNNNNSYFLLDVTKVDAKDPTCLESGNIEYWVYNEDEYYSNNHATGLLTEKQIIIPATGHTWSDWETITKATCTTDGLKMRYCTACGKTEKPKIKKLGHDYIATVVEPTCTKQGYTEYKCSRCSDSYKDSIKPALGHDYVDTVVPPTCTKGRLYAAQVFKMRKRIYGQQNTFGRSYTWRSSF